MPISIICLIHVTVNGYKFQFQENIDLRSSLQSKEVELSMVQLELRHKVNA